jgi:hypothetical protein
VHKKVPPEATVLVVSRGDDELLKLYGRTAWHFPQAEDGSYLGHYPPDSAAAIAHLEALRVRGVTHLIFPDTALWWLEHYAEFTQHLADRYEVVVRQPETCLVFALHERSGGPHSLAARN